MADDTAPTTPATPPPTLSDPAPATPARRRRSASSKSGGGNEQPEAKLSEKPEDKPEEQPEEQKPSAKKPGKRSSANPVAGAAEEVSSWPVPGGLGLMLLFLVILLVIMVPVNGSKTRAQLIWDTLRGKVKTPGVLTQADQQAGATSSVAGAASAASSASSVAQAGVQSLAGGILGTLTDGAVGGAGVPALGVNDLGSSLGLDAGYSPYDLDAVFNN